MYHHLQFIMLLLTLRDISQCTQWKMRINIYFSFIYCINNSKVRSRQVMIWFWGLCNKSFRITGGIHFAKLKYVETLSHFPTKWTTLCLANETITTWFLGVTNYFWILGEGWPHLIFKLFVDVEDGDGGDACVCLVSGCFLFCSTLNFLPSSQN